MTATLGTDTAAVNHDPLVSARTGLSVTQARYWLALTRAQNAEGTRRTSELAQARHEFDQATVLRRRVQALEAERADTLRKPDQPQSPQRVREPPSSARDRHRGNGIIVGRLPARTCS
jgi:hypothetical protein